MYISLLQHLKEQLQYCIDKAKDEVAELKVKLWENEYKIRQQVSQEYNQQIVEIEEKMKLVGVAISDILYLQSRPYSSIYAYFFTHSCFPVNYICISICISIYLSIYPSTYLFNIIYSIFCLKS